MNWTSNELAERIAGNPSLKLKSKSNPLSPKVRNSPSRAPKLASEHVEPVERLEFSAPIKTISEANQSNREHWAKKSKRKKAQQAEIDAEFLKALKGRRIALPCVVRLTRYGPKALDSDNLAGAFKGIRDAIAKRIGVDDGSESIRFEYSQVPVRERSYAIKVEIKPMAIHYPD